MEMKAVLLRAPNDLEIGTTTKPSPEPDEVILRVQACGICGTDMHTLSGNNPLVRYPAIPGHEFVGTVEEVGTAVGRLRPGDRVAVDPSRSCGDCYYCRSGWPNLCPEKGGHGSRIPGGFAQYVAAKENACITLRDDLSWERAALAEPLACVLHGMDRLGPVLGKRALVYGAGPIGLLAAALLAQAGADVGIVERSATRRALVEQWGIPTDAAAAAFAGKGRGCDVVVDATGVPQAMEDGFSQLGRAGTFLLLGVAPADKKISVSPFAINWQELTILGSMAIRHTFQRAVEILPDIRLPLETLVTHRVSLDDFQGGVDLVKSREALKVLVEPA